MTTPTRAPSRPRPPTTRRRQPSTTSSTTTAPTAPPTTSEADLEAQVAADYQRSWELRNELASNPTLVNLDARVAEIAADGSPEFDGLKAFIEELVALEERIEPNEPDHFSITVEGVELDGSPPYTTAEVTLCYVDNRLRVNAAGDTVRLGELTANRARDSVALTPAGWLPDGEYKVIWTGLGVMTCPPA